MNVGNKKQSEQKILWIDCETTGLDEKTDVILEVAVILTDTCLHEIVRQSYVVHHNTNMLKMNEFAQRCHYRKHRGYETSLVEACRESDFTLDAIEDSILLLLEKHTTKNDTIFAAGSSVSTDLKFIALSMPRLYQRFHYRIIDVSTIYQSVLWWSKNMLKNHPVNSSCHRAMSDIESTLTMMRYYKNHLFSKKRKRIRKKKSSNKETL